ncbi:MAG: DUF2071 domain-containing protein [Chloroflexaceae bacterium]|nr:DUF2071 domain-containing protein [Chloroflexaceae bacterium]
MPLRRQLDDTHRPWPLPARPWVMVQRWHDLLFGHWPLNEPSTRERLERLLPAGLDLDTFDDQAWIGVVPFRMSGVRLRLTPSVRGLSAFPELNVRTYVRHRDKPGVFFFSLDAGQLAAVLIARAWFQLPYFQARMKQQGSAYSSQRRVPAQPVIGLQAHYGPVGTPFLAQPGSLVYWLTERYCLYTTDAAGRLACGEIHHAPWLLQAAWADITYNTMTLPLGLDVPAVEPLLHFARFQQVLVWPLQRVA